MLLLAEWCWWHLSYDVWWWPLLSRWSASGNDSPLTVTTLFQPLTLFTPGCHYWSWWSCYLLPWGLQLSSLGTIAMHGFLSRAWGLLSQWVAFNSPQVGVIIGHGGLVAHTPGTQRQAWLITPVTLAWQHCPGALLLMSTGSHCSVLQNIVAASRHWCSPPVTNVTLAFILTGAWTMVGGVVSRQPGAETLHCHQQSLLTHCHHVTHHSTWEWKFVARKAHDHKPQSSSLPCHNPDDQSLPKNSSSQPNLVSGLCKMQKLNHLKLTMKFKMADCLFSLLIICVSFKWWLSTGVVFDHLIVVTDNVLHDSLTLNLGAWPWWIANLSLLNTRHQLLLLQSKNKSQSKLSVNLSLLVTMQAWSQLSPPMTPTWLPSQELTEIKSKTQVKTDPSQKV